MPRVFQRLTFQGSVCLLGAALSLGSSWLFSNALAFLIGYALLFGLGFHWIISRFCVQKLEVELVPLGTHARAYEAFPFEARLTNRSTWLPIRSPSIRTVESGRKREGTLQVPCALLPGQTAKITFYPQFGRRGKQRLIAVEAFSFSPLGMTRSSCVFSQVSRAVSIWPEAISPPIELFRAWENQPQTDRESVRRTTAEQMDPNLFRGYLPGDAMRRINWKLSAKTSALVVNQNPNNAQARLWLRINTHPSHWKRPVDFESGIRLLASALEFGFKRRMLAGITINDRQISIRSYEDFTRAVDQISELGMDLGADPRIPDLKRGEFLIVSSKKGVAIQTSIPQRVAV